MEKFRLEIIKSNNWACEHCKNNKIIKNYKRGNFYEASKYKNNEFSLEDGIFCFYVEFHSGIFSIRALHWTKDENFFDELSEDDEILFEHKSNYREFKTRIIGIKKGKDWVHVNNMHV